MRRIDKKVYPCEYADEYTFREIERWKYFDRNKETKQ